MNHFVQAVYKVHCQFGKLDHLSEKVARSIGISIVRLLIGELVADGE
jgi:hypothetical protein